MPPTENVLSAAEIEATAVPVKLARTIEAAVLAKLRQHDVESLIDRAYQEFIAMRAGTGGFRGEPWDEMDAFKAHMRRFAYARYHEMIGEVLRSTKGEQA